ncbi:MAG: SMI1/KNR4 family protein [Sphingobacteriales bacterium]|nr:MAG: SMI1/KNR4 family protein [Sphingobacteriales bacterium]
MTPTWISLAIKQWSAEAIQLNAPATPERIVATEQTVGFEFPEAFKEFYLQLDGFVDWDWTSNMFSIWPLERILEEYQQSPEKHLVGFADWLIRGTIISFIKGRDGIYKSYDFKSEPELITTSFSELIHLINSDSERLY